MTVLASLQGIRFGYEAGRPVLEGVDLAVHAGEFVALTGPNGSGKSTLLRIMLGLTRPQAGTVTLGDGAGRQPRIGFVPQRLVLARDLPANVEDVVATGRLAKGTWRRRSKAADREAVRQAIEAVGLGAERSTRVGFLSGGQQQRVLIAKALAAEPDLLILDEPTAGVDAESQRGFRNVLVRAVQERGAAVLLVSHELGSVAPDLDRIAVLKRSIIFDGPPAELARRGVSLGIHEEDLPLWLEALR